MQVVLPPESTIRSSCCTTQACSKWSELAFDLLAESVALSFHPLQVRGRYSLQLETSVSELFHIWGWAAQRSK